MQSHILIFFNFSTAELKTHLIISEIDKTAEVNTYFVIEAFVYIQFAHQTELTDLNINDLSTVSSKFHPAHPPPIYAQSPHLGFPHHQHP